MKEIPETPFREIAVVMESVANGAAMSIDIAQAQRWAHGPGTQAELAALAVDAKVAGELAMLFAALAPNEELVRDFMTGLLAAPVDLAAVPTRRRA